MNTAVLGTGDVGRSLAEGFARAGHRVLIAGRAAQNVEVERYFLDRALQDAVHYRDFQSAAAECEIAVLCVSGTHALSVADTVREARGFVRGLLVESLGWRDVVDLGALIAARAMESYLHLWLHLWRSVGHARFNIALVAAPAVPV